MSKGRRASGAVVSGTRVSDAVVLDTRQCLTWWVSGVVSDVRCQTRWCLTWRGTPVLCSLFTANYYLLFTVSDTD
ncbi:MAG: hypothetical protein LBK25_00970 [Treponema sp.]|nr:hypothetical protein [Treponema sp.]